MTNNTTLYTDASVNHVTYVVPFPIDCAVATSVSSSSVEIACVSTHQKKLHKLQLVSSLSYCKLERSY